MMNKYNPLLDTILNSIKSRKDWIKMLNTSRISFRNRDSINKKSDYYSFKISEDGMNYRYAINVYRIKRLFRNRYITTVIITENKSYGNDIEELIFDSRKDNSYPKQKFIFDTLYFLDTQKKRDLDEEKVNKYVMDVKKSVDKSIVRDDKINELLNK